MDLTRPCSNCAISDPNKSAGSQPRPTNGPLSAIPNCKDFGAGLRGEIQTCADREVIGHPAVAITVDRSSAHQTESRVAFVPDFLSQIFQPRLKIQNDNLKPVDTVLEICHPSPVTIVDGGQLLLWTGHQSCADRQGCLAPHPCPALHPRLPGEKETFPAAESSHKAIGSRTGGRFDPSIVEGWGQALVKCQTEGGQKDRQRQGLHNGSLV